jgi:CheY-like chemotaxis protein
MPETGSAAFAWLEQPPLILLAEDSETNIATLSSYLRWLGARVEVARDGEVAVQATLALKPDVVLMDVQMPRVDGLEAIRRLRAQVETALVPVIALTAFAMPGDSERCLAAGATLYLSKPVRLRQLKYSIERLLPQLAGQTIP